MPARATSKLPQLSFIFTQHGFVPDVATDAESGKPRLSHESMPWYKRFLKDRKAAIYDLGFAADEPWFTPSMRYLRRIADTFLRNTLQQPDVELLRQAAPPALDDATTSELLLALPFCPGAEHVDDVWLTQIWNELTQSFAKDISAWDGTVEQYVASRTQDLRVPGRIFFHLVDNPQGTQEGRPFAFVATYATSEQGEVRHYPLRYALTQYAGDQSKILGLLADLSRAANTTKTCTTRYQALNNHLYHGTAPGRGVTHGVGRPCARRSPSHKEPRRKADALPQGAERGHAHSAYGYAGGKRPF